VSWLRSRAIAPPGGGPAGAAAPVDSTRFTSGRRLTEAIRAARRIFSTVYGLTAPPSTVGSLAMTTHSTPSTTPMPVTTLAPIG